MYGISNKQWIEEYTVRVYLRKIDDIFTYSFLKLCTYKTLKQMIGKYFVLKEYLGERKIRSTIFQWLFTEPCLSQIFFNRKEHIVWKKMIVFELWVNRWQYLLITSTLLFFSKSQYKRFWGWSWEDWYYRNIYTLLFAMKRPPLFIHPGLIPVSSSMLFTRWFIWFNSWISVSLGRNLQTNPAVCHVVPTYHTMYHYDKFLYH